MGLGFPSGGNGVPSLTLHPKEGTIHTKVISVKRIT